MLNLDAYNQEGKKTEAVKLPERVFGVEINHDLIHQTYVAQKANSRIAVAHTKTRGEVRGGGAKPWKQKGTGRARHGSIRSPLWVGGGVTFGPRSDRNFSKKINKKQKQKALFMVLSSKLNDGELIMLEELKFDGAKTKNGSLLADTVSKKILKKDRKQKMLVVLPEKNDDIRLAFRNLPSVKVILADSLNVGDLLDYKYVVMSKSAVSVIDKTYSKIKK